MNIQDKRIKIDSYLRTHGSSLEWNLMDEEDVYYELQLPTEMGNLIININIESSPYTVITCILDNIWNSDIYDKYIDLANEWMLGSDILRVIIDKKAELILFSYTYTAMEDFFDAGSLIGLAESLIKKILETCMPKLYELDRK